ncbi:ulp1 protease family protein, partial [Colletotrichum incanum]
LLPHQNATTSNIPIPFAHVTLITPCMERPQGIHDHSLPPIDPNNATKINDAVSQFETECAQGRFNLLDSFTQLEHGLAPFIDPVDLRQLLLTSTRDVIVAHLGPVYASLSHTKLPKLKAACENWQIATNYALFMLGVKDNSTGRPFFESLKQLSLLYPHWETAYSLICDAARRRRANYKFASCTKYVATLPGVHTVDIDTAMGGKKPKAKNKGKQPSRADRMSHSPIPHSPSPTKDCVSPKPSPATVDAPSPEALSDNIVDTSSPEATRRALSGAFFGQLDNDQIFHPIDDSALGLKSQGVPGRQGSPRFIPPDPDMSYDHGDQEGYTMNSPSPSPLSDESVGKEDEASNNDDSNSEEDEAPFSDDLTTHEEIFAEHKQETDVDDTTVPPQQDQTPLLHSLVDANTKSSNVPLTGVECMVPNENNEQRNNTAAQTIQEWQQEELNNHSHDQSFEYTRLSKPNLPIERLKLESNITMRSSKRKTPSRDEPVSMLLPATCVNHHSSSNITRKKVRVDGGRRAQSAEIARAGTWVRGAWLNGALDDVVRCMDKVSHLDSAELASMGNENYQPKGRLLRAFWDSNECLLPCLVSGDHWVMTVLAIRNQSITNVYLFDPMPSPEHMAAATNAVGHLKRRYFPQQRRQHDQGVHTHNDVVITQTAGPRQENDDDCGVFVFVWALFFMLKKPPPETLDAGFWRRVLAFIVDPAVGLDLAIVFPSDKSLVVVKDGDDGRLQAINLKGAFTVASIEETFRAMED